MLVKYKVYRYMDTFVGNFEIVPDHVIIIDSEET